MNKISASFYKHPLKVSIFLALLLRTLAAVFNYGPAAIDDYNNIIAPALKLLQTGEHPQIPSLRFELLPWLFYFFMLPFSWLGIEQPYRLVSGGYFVMGLYSLLMVGAFYRIGCLIFADDKRWPAWLTLLAAVHFLSPFYGTRMYLGSLAMVPMSWAVYFLLKERFSEFSFRDALLAGFFLSAVVYFRFVLAPLYFTAVIWYLFRRRDRVLPFLLGGLITAVLMVFSEVLTGKYPLQTAVEFLKYNLQAHFSGGPGYGSMAWYAYIGILLYFFIPPLSILYIWPLIRGIKKLPLIALLFFAFLIPHSMLAYKLDRFVYPVIPLFFLLTVYGIYLLRNHRWLVTTFKGFLFVSFLFSFAVAFSGSQLSGIDAMTALRQKSLNNDRNIYIYKVNPVRYGYFGFDIKNRPVIINDLSSIDEKTDFYLLNFMDLNEGELKVLAEQNITCKKKKTYWPAFLESIVIKLNPKHNMRRRENVLYLCAETG